LRAGEIGHVDVCPVTLFRKLKRSSKKSPEMWRYKAIPLVAVDESDVDVVKPAQ
jgi:hypothetical protein